MRLRRGQASVEYLLLLSMTAGVALLVGAFIARFGRGLLDDVAAKVLDAILVLAMP